MLIKISKGYVLSNLLQPDHHWRVATTDEGRKESKLQTACAKSKARTSRPLQSIGFELLQSLLGTMQTNQNTLYSGEFSNRVFYP